MRYHVKLQGLTLGDPVEGLKGADTPKSRLKALQEVAQRAGFNTWAEMMEGSSRAKDIVLKPLKQDLEAYYDSLKGPMTWAQRQSIDGLAKQAGFKSTATAAGVVGRTSLKDFTQGEASRLIDRLTAGLAEQDRIQCEAALRDAYSAIKGPISERQLEYLLDLAEDAGYPSFSEAVRAVMGDDYSQDLTKGEACFMMDRLKAQCFEGSAVSYSGH